MCNFLLFIDRPGHDDDGDLDGPTSIVVTPEHTVMISDFINDRISAFSLDDGRFIRHVLTEKDGIDSPRCISLEGNLLWVSYDLVNTDHYNIRCYKLLYKT